MQLSSKILTLYFFLLIFLDKILIFRSYHWVNSEKEIFVYGKEAKFRNFAYLEDLHQLYIFHLSLTFIFFSLIYVVDLQLPMKSAHITTNVLSSNLAHSEVYSIQHYVIKFVSDLWQGGGFLRVLRFHPPIKLTSTI